MEHDVADEAAWNAVAERVRQRGRLDGLVNNAGIYRPEPIASTDAALFDLHYRVNQLGAFFGIRMAAEVGGAG
ncbi:SDR family NAD(P)-dependent oxidoreductase, partial [Klebsiella pneumoniae]|uniref:SDR family NAD(P)-dependent oxidoreductase n=1 Tax=Klebsiella pneumoniae TaxID=573 RepID=UPI003CED9691